MRQRIESEHRADDKGLPAGGTTTGCGITIEWQAGPLPHPDRLVGDPHKVFAEDIGANGAFVEGVIAAAIDRIMWYETVSEGRFANSANKKAIGLLSQALEALDERTKERMQRGVLGTHAA